MPTIIQIVPHLPPTISGVGDYARLLAGQLRRGHGIKTRFVIGNPDWNGPAELGGFPVRKLSERTATAMKKVLETEGEEESPVLLHYVGYGYQKRGCPVWLVKGLENWKMQKAESRERKGDSRTRRAEIGDGKLESAFQLSAFSISTQPRLVTIFHELFASGPIWTSAFWTSILQRLLAARLVRLSDRCCTNRRRSAEWLQRQLPQGTEKIPALPVFSNFGESSPPDPLVSRPAQAVMFGRLGRTIRNGEPGWAVLARVCRQLGLEQLVSIGGHFPADIEKTLSIKLVRQDSVTPAQAGDILSHSRVGMLDYFNGYLGKSGIFAAYCGQGLTPVLLTSNDSEAEGLQQGQHFLVAATLESSLTLPQMQTVADAAHRWYARHDLTTTAQSVFRLMQPPPCTS